MNFLKKVFIVYDRTGEPMFFTPRKLYERILKDSESNYNWVTSAAELVNTMKDPAFPEEFAIGIKIKILKCFAYFNLHITDSRHTKEDEEAVYYCYNTLYDVDDEEAQTVRISYLKSVISHVALYHFEFPIHQGKTYYDLVSEWKDEKLVEYIDRQNIDFPALYKTLHEDFGLTIKENEEKGLFEEDDKKFTKDVLKLADLINPYL